VRPVATMGASLLSLWAVALAVPVFAAPAPVNGEALFRQRCQACHSVAATGSAGVGPNLKAVVGRKAAGTGFNYSPALTQSKLTWTPATLDKFLSGPTRMVPGTRMIISLTDAAQRKAVIQYLSGTK
jgi:cytochrome c